MKTRRSFFKELFIGLAGLSIGSVFYSIYSFLFHSKIIIPNKSSQLKIFDVEQQNSSPNRLNFIPAVGSDGSFEFQTNLIQKGESVVTGVTGKPLIILHLEDGYRAFNATCSHLGCMVAWHAEESKFICPCHKGQYDKDGNVIAGPPQKPLEEYLLSVKNNTVKINPV